jgi:dTDP-4-dehydrorhamnose 3,5-epimerase
MKFIETEFPGVVVIEPIRYGDERGYFSEVFKLEEIHRAIGPVNFIQDNESFSRRGVLRGLHYQRGEASQAKLVRVSQGKVIDVIVDLRQSSPTYGQHKAVELSADTGRQLFVPRGFAHGFVVISDVAQFQYKVDNAYCPTAEACIKYDDADLAIAWPQIEGGYILSPKDLQGVSFAKAEKFD